MLTLLRERFAEEMSTRGASAKEEMPTFSEHMADAATDSYDRDCALAMLSSTQTVLYEIEQALNRIMTGTYGVCEATGKPIETERLAAIPWARFSAEAQAELEAQGGGERTHLGELGTVSASVGQNDATDEEEVPEAPVNGRKKKSEMALSA